MKISYAAMAVTGLLMMGGKANADAIPYPTPGIENSASYTFIAGATGNIDAYFHGSAAAYTTEIGMSVNGVSTGIFGLNNQTSAYGLMLTLGAVTAGDVVVFDLYNLSVPEGPWHSDTSLNADGKSHVYATSFSGDLIIPAGTYVGFEDLNGGGDFDYNDETFVFTNVRTSVPEPTTLLLMGLGVAAMGALRKRSA